MEGEVEETRPRWMPRVGVGEKSGLSDVAELEGFLVLENVEVVVLLVLENDGVTDGNSGVLPL